ncbi:MAG: class I SAM-dependent methyltransferase [Candidatus Latescibacteria bacterium]|jgi:2-polyprenyl-3-methyl-5-hydroxy-6-metoxy-1,4-benzoquinol methylase|nr:class I SAM-dependent methyltransferase [Candidatus Latescibacterota bacterium]
MIGKELVHDESLSKLERLYIKVFGVPINGLRIRARRVLPHVTAGYKSILDSGCGQGIFTFEIARRFPGSSLTGIDINEELLKRNRRIAEIAGLKNCRFEFRDITEISTKEQYDLILSVDVLEHIEDDQNTLRCYYSALTSGGDLLLHVPAYMRRWFFFRWKVNFDVDGHFRAGYTMDDIVNKVKNAGFSIVEKYYTYGWLETVTNNISYLITGARMKNKYVYALVFPFLLGISYFGKNVKPAQGAGILIKARK